ncbi:hypothetical protein Tco_1370341 [Tanacetum coccineum]
MSSASSAVTYTSIYIDFEPGRVFWGADEELSDGGSLLVPVYGYDGLPMQLVAPPSPDYIPGPEEPLAPLPPDFVPEPVYPEFLVPSDAEEPIEEQLYAADASPTALSPGYVADSDPKEDPEEDHADYPTDDDDDDDDADDEDEETSDDEEEEEEHLAPADPSAVPVVDHVPSAGDTEAVEAEEPAPTSPRTRVPFSQTRLRRARKTIPSPPLPPLPSSSLPPPVPASLPLPSSPLPPLPPSLFIPPVDRREDIPEDELPPRKRLCSTAPTSRYEVGESSTAAPRPTGGHRVDYGFIGTLDAETRRQRAEAVGYGIRDTWVDPREAAKEVALTTLKGVNTKMIGLAAVQEQDT